MTAGYFLEYGRSAPPSHHAHLFGGPAPWSGANCPNCRKPLVHFATLDASDPRLCVPDGGQIPLLYCWRCNLAQGDFYYSVSRSGVAVVKYKRGGVQSDFPYADYPEQFPAASAWLTPVSEACAKIVAARNRGAALDWSSQEGREYDRLRHQVGGEPRLVQGYPPRRLRCVSCKRSMPLFATVADDCLDPRGFAGNSWVQVLYVRCDTCGIIAAFHECE